MSEKVRTVASIIEEAKKTNSKKIDFNNAEDTMDNIPDDLFELENLEYLNFGNRFTGTKIPSKILKLSNLKNLAIENDNFIDFPLELMQIKSLEELKFDSYSLVEIPKQLKEWKTLSYLNLSECSNLKRIFGLPPDLTYIYLNGISINNFPEEILNLMNLRKLVLHNFKFKNLPTELFNLNNLVSLFVGDNQLSSLPKELSNLNNLLELWIDNNNFTEIPEVVYQLKNLETLNVSGNNLTEISPSIINLSNLSELYLRNNIFTEIPGPIFEMPSIKELYFGNYGIRQNLNLNNITIIPEQILKLDNLIKFEVYQNPIENVPPEIIADGIKAIKNFLLSKIEADTEEFLYEAKMVVVGRGDVGKTVLTKKLSDENYTLEKSLTTKGIKILKYPYEFKMSGLKNTNSFRFNIWDFGGQEKYDATHQLFITNRSVYLFLTEARSESNYQDVFYWLNTISLFSYNSPVIIVLSKYDERKKILPESIYKDKFPNIVDFVDVSCATGYEYTIGNLKAAISGAIKLLPQTKLTLSNHWIDIRNTLEKLSFEKDYIEYLEYLTICAENNLDNTRADFLGEYLNDLGVIIHHKHDLLLKKTVFINTDWCVDGMYKVLDDEIVFKNKGKFTNYELSNIWHEERFKNKQAELIRLMQDYSLCFELADGSGYIAPDLLPPDKPSTLKWGYENSLQFEYQYTFMPAGIVSRFIVKSHSFIKEKLYWKYGVVLIFDDTEALIEENYINNKIIISINGVNKKGLLAAIKMFIEEVHKDFDKSNKLVFEEMVPCNCKECVNSFVPHFFKFNVLRKFEQKSIIEIPCEKSSELVKIKRLINDVQIPNPSEYLDSHNDLKDFILDILVNTLDKEITLKGSYINFWRDKSCKTPKDEVEIHPYICNTIENFCKVKGINLAREVRHANGSVDILFSYTTKDNRILKVCVEVKKAHHKDILTAIKTQLPMYMESAETHVGIYLVVWFKNSNFIEPRKFESPKLLESEIVKNNPDSENITIQILDCNKSISPSKVK